MKVREIMVQPIVTAGHETSLEDVAKLMLERRIGCLPIVDGKGDLCGIVTNSDFAGKDCCFPFSIERWPQVLRQWLPKGGLERIYQDARARTAKEIMTKDVETLGEDDTVEDAVKRMVDREVHHLPVVCDGKPIGIVSRHDLLRLMLPRARKCRTCVSVTSLGAGV